MPKCSRSVWGQFKKIGVLCINDPLLCKRKGNMVIVVAADEARFSCRRYINASATERLGDGKRYMLIKVESQRKDTFRWSR